MRVPYSRKAIRRYAVLAMTIVSAGCSTHRVGLEYGIPEIGVLRAETSAAVGVAPFRDERDAGTDWLGAIRGGYGNPLKKLRTNGPTVNLVTQAFREGLESRGLLSTGAEPDLLVTGAVRRMDCNYLVNREAHAHFLVEVVDAESSEELFEKLYQVDEKEGGVGAGVFASVETLRRLAERTMGAAIDKAIDDPAFRDAIGATGGGE